jgi:sugar diacid utilization regulator
MLTVRDVMNIAVMDGFRLVAGKEGLYRPILCPGIVDTEDLEELHTTVRTGEYLITKFQIIQDEPEYIADYIEVMADRGASCLVVKSTYFKDLPNAAKIIADSRDFPVFFFDDVYIDKLIIEINNAIQSDEFEARNLHLIEEITGPSAREEDVVTIAKLLNRQFESHYLVCFVKKRGQLSRNDYYSFDYKSVGKLLGSRSMAISYSGGYLIIGTFSERDEGYIKNGIMSLLNNYCMSDQDYVIGQSTIKHRLGLLGQSIREAVFACEYGLEMNRRDVVYEDLGIYKLLMELKNDSRGRNHYMPYINLLQEHDRLHDTDLLNTAIALVRAEGDIQKTSSALYQHANTVRYRMKRIAKIMGGDQMKGLIYENLAMVIRLYLLDERK